MNRRTLLAWLSYGMQACIAAAIAIPGMQYVLAGLRPGRKSQATHQRVARLADLRVGQPLQVAVMGRKQDGWTLADSQVVGRVWLVRSDGPEPQVQAFTSVCPHMGCQIQLNAQATNFICPCHRAAFGRSGEPLPASQTGERNHAPRAMDSLDCQIVQDETSGESWVEVKYEKFEPGLTRKVVRA
jgi:Rieske Fe-S protein